MKFLGLFSIILFLSTSAFAQGIESRIKDAETGLKALSTSSGKDLLASKNQVITVYAETLKLVFNDIPSSTTLSEPQKAAHISSLLEQVGGIMEKAASPYADPREIPWESSDWGMQNIFQRSGNALAWYFQSFFGDIGHMVYKGNLLPIHALAESLNLPGPIGEIAKNIGVDASRSRMFKKLGRIAVDEATSTQVNFSSAAGKAKLASLKKYVEAVKDTEPVKYESRHRAFLVTLGSAWAAVALIDPELGTHTADSPLIFFAFWNGIGLSLKEAYAASSGYKFARSIDTLQYMVDHQGQPDSFVNYHKDNIVANCSLAFGALKAIITGSTN